MSRPKVHSYLLGRTPAPNTKRFLTRRSDGIYMLFDDDDEGHEVIRGVYLYFDGLWDKKKVAIVLPVQTVELE